MFYVIGNYWGWVIHKKSKNLKHVHKDSNYLISVITTLVTNVNDGETVFKIE